MASTEPANEFPSNPWTRMWTKPRVTIQQIVDSDPTRYVLVLAAVGGLFSTLDRASARSTGDNLDFTTIIAIALTLGPLAGLVSLFVGGALVRWTGSWIGGDGSLKDIRAALAWGVVPLLWVSLLWIPELLLFGEEMFTTETPRIAANPTLALVLIAFVMIELAGAIWATVTLVKSVAQIQGFSAWMGLGNLLLATVVVLVPLVILAFLFGELLTPA